MPTTMTNTGFDQLTTSCTARPVSDWRENALDIRREWMSALGMDDEEIENHCGPTAVADLDEEIAQRSAMERLQELNQSLR